ncbi:MAG: hypothetical protein H5T74_07170 [Actinobacteria bacterium]|nr:hypothetical protein [Actinomycetota bacterium]
MGWSESYQDDMAAEAGREFSARLREVMEALRRLRLSASTYRHFHPPFDEAARRAEGWEEELAGMLWERGEER